MTGVHGLGDRRDEPRVATRITSLIAEGLRTVLDQPSAPTRSDPLPAYGDPEAAPLVDLADREAVWAALDATE